MKTMTKEEIIAKVNTIRPGAFTKIRWLGGAPVPLDTDTDLYVVKEMLVRFKLNYRNQPTIKWTEQICNAVSPSEVLDAHFAYQSLSEAKKAVVPARYQTMLKKKISDSVKEVTIDKSPRIFEGKTHDPEHPFIIQCKNGNTLLTCFNAFALNVHTKSRWETKTFYYSENRRTGKITEVSPVTPEIAAALKKAEKLARSAAKKPAVSTPSLVYTIAVKNIISIG